MALIFLGAMESHQSFARNPSYFANNPDYMKQLNTIIKESVKYPDFTLNKEERGDISVIFTLTDDGKIKVEKIIAPTKRVEDYVKKQLTDVSAKDVIHPYNQKYKVKFRFENS